MELIEKLDIRLDDKGYKRRWAKFKCSYCLLEVERTLSHGKTQKSCGCVRNKLISETKKGVHPTIETRQKMSIAQKGQKQTELTKQKKSLANKGKKRTEEQRQRYSEAFKGRVVTEKTRKNISKTRIEQEVAKGDKNPMYGIHRFGEQNPNWNNGSSFEPYGLEFNKEFKQSIYERDNYTCQNPKCAIENLKRLDCHHIDYDKQNNISENVITLCRSCHAKTNGKNNRQYWTGFYQNIMRVKCILV